MAVRSFTYLDIPAAKRQDSAAKAASRLRERLNDPLTTPDQVGKIQAQLSKIEQWARGTPPTEGT